MVPVAAVDRLPAILLVAPDVEGATLIDGPGVIVAPASHSPVRSVGSEVKSVVAQRADGAAMSLPLIKKNDTTEPNCKVVSVSLSKCREAKWCMPLAIGH